MPPTEKSLNLLPGWHHELSRRPGLTLYSLDVVLSLVVASVKYLGHILIWRGVPLTSGSASVIAKLSVVLYNAAPSQ